MNPTYLYRPISQKPGKASDQGGRDAPHAGNASIDAATGQAVGRHTHRPPRHSTQGASPAQADGDCRRNSVGDTP